MSSTVSTSEQSVSRSFNGRVKWFNNKAGYGFITTENDTYSGDVFVHHSALFTANEQYKYLVQGEYVEFQLSRVTGGTHEWQAEKVSGLNGGKLMCETRNETRSSRQGGDDEQAPVVQRRQRPQFSRVRAQDQADEVQTPRRDDQAPRHRPRRIPVKVVGGALDSNSEWMLIRRTPYNVPRKALYQQQEQSSGQGQETEVRAPPRRRHRVVREDVQE
jgi:CspA family cold shock protein